MLVTDNTITQSITVPYLHSIRSLSGNKSESFSTGGTQDRVSVDHGAGYRPPIIWCTTSTLPSSSDENSPSALLVDSTKSSSSTSSFDSLLQPCRGDINYFANETAFELEDSASIVTASRCC